MELALVEPVPPLTISICGARRVLRLLYFTKPLTGGPNIVSMYTIFVGNTRSKAGYDLDEGQFHDWRIYTSSDRLTFKNYMYQGTFFEPSAPANKGGAVETIT